MRKYGDIVDRIEIIRNSVNLNKSQFAQAVGIKPQTYQNFIGVQGSKPSLDLIVGVVDRFHVSPYWLLNGSGLVYLQETVPDCGRDATGRHGLPSPAKSASVSTPSQERMELIQQTVRLLVQLQVLLGRLQEDFASIDASGNQAIN